MYSIQFSCSVVSDSLWPHELQHTRPPCPSISPGVHSNSRPSSLWCHPAISSSVVPFSCPQSLPASESFPMSQLFAWGGQSTGVSALASFLPVNTQGWSPSEWTGWISLQSKGLSRVFNTTVQKHQFFGAQLPSQSNSHIHTCISYRLLLNRQILYHLNHQGSPITYKWSPKSVAENSKRCVIFVSPDLCSPSVGGFGSRSLLSAVGVSARTPPERGSKSTHRLPWGWQDSVLLTWATAQRSSQVAALRASESEQELLGQKPQPCVTWSWKCQAVLSA